MAAKAFRRSPVLRNRVRNAGEIADFIDWQTERLGDAKVYRSREKLWTEMAKRIDPDRSWHGVEFGVAWGYATEWWLRRLPLTSSWDGFDRFTGLPRGWREHKPGAFDTGGQPPDISDPRVRWHIGDVEETTRDLDVDSITNGGRLVLFDLDIYEPTAAAWEAVQPLLQPGDLLYFDEAMDPGERRVLNEFVLPAKEIAYIGCTSMGLGLEIR